MKIEVGIFAWLLFGIVSAFVARKKGRSGCAWFALGVLLGPFGLLLAFAAQPRKAPAEEPVKPPPPSEPPIPGGMIKCPSCGELVRQDSIRCRFCGEKITSARAVVSSEHWTCPRCSASNAAKLARCGNCGWAPE